MSAIEEVIVFLRDVAKRLTWRGLLLALLLGAALGAIRYLGLTRPPPASFHYSNALIVSIMALFTWIAVVGADELVSRGARRVWTYPTALFIAAVSSAISQRVVHGWLGLFTVVDQPAISVQIRGTQMLVVALDVLVFGGLVLLIYLNRAHAARVLRSVQNAELDRAEIERRIAESRLSAASSHVDPQLLVDDLGDIQSQYEENAPEADATLDGFIERLRATLTAHGAAAAIGR
jgi:hypothetical protein